MMKKIIVAVAISAVCIFLGILLMGNTNSQDGDVQQCSPRAIGVMNSITPGESYHSVLLRLDKLNLTYSIWKDGVEVVPLQNSQMPVGPLEILITINDEKVFGLFVGKRNSIRVDIDSLNKVVMRSCSVVLAGP